MYLSFDVLLLSLLLVQFVALLMMLHYCHQHSMMFLSSHRVSLSFHRSSSSSLLFFEYRCVRHCYRFCYYRYQHSTMICFVRCRVDRVSISRSVGFLVVRFNNISKRKKRKTDYFAFGFLSFLLSRDDDERPST